MVRVGLGRLLRVNFSVGDATLAVEGARAEEEDGMANNWEGTEIDELFKAFRRNMPWLS